MLGSRGLAWVVAFGEPRGRSPEAAVGVCGVRDLGVGEDREAVAVLDLVEEDLVEQLAGAAAGVRVEEPVHLLHPGGGVPVRRVHPPLAEREGQPDAARELQETLRTARATPRVVVQRAMPE